MQDPGAFAVDINPREMRLLIADNVHNHVVSYHFVVSVEDRVVPIIKLRQDLSAAALLSCAHISFDRAGSMFVADPRNHTVVKYPQIPSLPNCRPAPSLVADWPTDPSKAIAGLGRNPGVFGDHGPAMRALLRSPTALSFADDGSLFIADRGNDRVRRIAPGKGGFLEKPSIITTFVGANPDATVRWGIKAPHAVVALPKGGGVVFGDNTLPRVKFVGPNDDFERLLVDLVLEGQRVRHTDRAAFQHIKRDLLWLMRGKDEADQLSIDRALRFWRAGVALAVLEEDVDGTFDRGL